MLRYGMAELRETGGGAECGLWKLRNGNRVFHYVVKTWPQLMCCALI